MLQKPLSAHKEASIDTQLRAIDKGRVKIDEINFTNRETQRGNRRSAAKRLNLRSEI
jgi:hypothetical protein